MVLGFYCWWVLNFKKNCYNFWLLINRFDIIYFIWDKEDRCIFFFICISILNVIMGILCMYLVGGGKFLINIL